MVRHYYLDYELLLRLRLLLLVRITTTSTTTGTTCWADELSDSQPVRLAILDRRSSMQELAMLHRH